MDQVQNIYKTQCWLDKKIYFCFIKQNLKLSQIKQSDSVLVGDVYKSLITRYNKKC